LSAADEAERLAPFVCDFADAREWFYWLVSIRK